MLQRRSPVRGDDWHGMACSDTSSVVNARAHSFCSVPYSCEFFLLHGLSLPVRTGNALQNVNNGTPAVLSARSHLLDVISGDYCDKQFFLEAASLQTLPTHQNSTGNPW